VLGEGSCILTVTEEGYGKRTVESEYRVQSRGGKGLINLRLTPKTGQVVGIRQVFDDDDIMVMSNQGNLVRLRAADISRIGRNTQGVRLINMDSDQHLVGVVRVEEDNDRPIAEPLEEAPEDGEEPLVEDAESEE
jgi:DNA gyrase subunit A